MSIRQSKLIRFAVQHCMAARPVEGSDCAIKLDIPYVHVPTGATGVDTVTVTNMTELRDALGY